MKPGLKQGSALAALIVLSFFLSGYVVDLQPLFVIEGEAGSKVAAQMNNLGVQQYREGKFQEALGNFILASEMDETFGVYHYNCAVVFVAMNRFKEALEHLEMSKEIDPDNTKTIDFYTNLLEKVRWSV